MRVCLTCDVGYMSTCVDAKLLLPRLAQLSACMLAAFVGLLDLGPVVVSGALACAYFSTYFSTWLAAWCMAARARPCARMRSAWFHGCMEHARPHSHTCATAHVHVCMCMCAQAWSCWVLKGNRVEGVRVLGAVRRGVRRRRRKLFTACAPREASTLTLSRFCVFWFTRRCALPYRMLDLDAVPCCVLEPWS